MPPAMTGSAFVVRRFATFVGEFARSVAPRRAATAALLVLISSATEGISLLILVPLIDLLGNARGPVGMIGTAIHRALATLGLPLSLPVLLGTFISLIMVRAIVLVLRDTELSRLRIDFVDALRRRTYRAVATADWPFLMRQRLSDVLEALTARTDRIGSGAYFFLRLPALLVLGSVQLAIAFSLSPPLTLGVLCWGGLLFLAFHRSIGRRYDEGQQLFDVHRASFAEISDFLHALKIAKSCGAEARHVATFDAAVERQRVQTYRSERSDAVMRMAVQIAAAVSLGGFVYLAVTATAVSAAGILVMVVIFARLVPLILELQQGSQIVARMLPVFDSVIQFRARCVAASEPTVTNGGRIDVRREIRVSDVWFHYDTGREPAALEAIDLVIPAGSTVAIVGHTGAGKSTLADLLLGLIVPDKGGVFVDDVRLTTSVIARWRRSIGYVPQDNFLFNDTVRANLLWAHPEAAEADVRWALSMASADKFVAALPQGLDTVVGERGVLLSGGERQRLGLARALLGRPKFLVLDEATSALDAQTERAVQSAIEQLHRSTTIVIIAHRISTVRTADRIFVLERGRLVQSGTWGDLALERRGAFAALLGELEQGVRASPRK